MNKTSSIVIISYDYNSNHQLWLQWNPRTLYFPRFLGRFLLVSSLRQLFTLTSRLKLNRQFKLGNVLNRESSSFRFSGKLSSLGCQFPFLTAPTRGTAKHPPRRIRKNAQRAILSESRLSETCMATLSNARRACLVQTKKGKPAIPCIAMVPPSWPVMRLF